MRVIKAQIDGQVFFLTPDQNLDELKAEIVTAIRSGSDFVDFDTVGRENISVLITPNLPVRFETIALTEDQLDRWEDNPPPIDLIDYDNYG